MPKYVIERVEERVMRYTVDAVDEEDAESQVENDLVGFDEDYTGEASFRIVSEEPDTEPEQYWTAMGTFHITRYGTEADARAEIEQALGDVVDEYDIQSLD